MELETDVLQQRHGVLPVHTAQELTLLRNAFPANVELWTARAGTVMVAGMIVYVTPTVAHAQYIASSPDGRDSGALDAVVGAVLDRHRERQVFDFGISTTDSGRVLNEGLARNKESFGARAVCYDWYALALPASAGLTPEVRVDGRPAR